MSNTSSPDEQGQEKEEAGTKSWELKEEFQDMSGDGEWINLRSKRVLILPALISELAKITQMINEIQNISEEDGKDNETQAKLLDFCLWAIKQAYPNVTMQDIEKEVSIKSFQRVLTTVIAINDLGEAFMGKAPVSGVLPAAMTLRQGLASKA